MLGKRWTGLLIDLLLQREARFHELAAALPSLSRRVRTDRLSELQELGLVVRTVDPGTPPVTVTYAFTDRGRELEPAMTALRRWAGAPSDALPDESVAQAATARA